MRTISDQLQGVYDRFPVLPSVFTRVEIDRTGSDDWVDMSNLYGRDWVVAATYADRLDLAVASATVTFSLGFDHLSLSPFVAASPLNDGGVLIQPYRRLRIKTATLPMGAEPQEDDYVLVFRGRINDYGMRSRTITVNCRDDGGELQDAYIEEADIVRGADDGSVQVEDLMQDILDAHFNTSPGVPVTLYSENGTSGTPFNAGDSPGWAIRAYKQQRQPVLDALRVLAEQIGYSLKYRYHEGSGIDDFVLVLEEPPRAKSVVDFTFNSVLEVTNISLALQDIRNVVRVVYQDAGGRRQTSEDSDAASITKYGRRWMEIQEESASQIDTATEADKLRDAALGDLKEPTAVVAFTVPYFYPGQTTDLYGITNPDDVYADSAFALAPVSLEHDLAAATTRITAQGKPKARQDGWTGRQARHPSRQWASDNFASQSPIDSWGVLPNGFFKVWTKG